MFYIYAAKKGGFVPDRHADPALDDWYDDATEEYAYILIYNRELTPEEVSERDLVFLRKTDFKRHAHRT